MSFVKVQFGEKDLEVFSIRDEDDGQVWLMANPFARVLEYVSAPNAIAKFVSKTNQERLDRIQYQVINLPYHPSTKFINKAGLLELVIKSKMRFAAEFRYWLVNELFPTLKIDALDDFAVWRTDPTNRQTLEEQLPRDDDPIESGCVCDNERFV
ncbi:Bro4 [Heliothis virescens ascovirus 3f]|uniref:Bro4 n=1 Tax=Heliothis virescens ascovirus 3f TaxID=328614 RepID=A0A171PVC3_9VIRU|nr:Bro4 [Heliothis virescens ascovirus 3f]AJP09004.1 Bro4 [Heliothis virescens ascovirus 3f]